MQAIDLYRAIQAAALNAPTARQTELRAGALCWASTAANKASRAALFSYWCSGATTSGADFHRDQSHAEAASELMELECRSLAPKFLTFKHCGGRIKLLNTVERLQGFAADMLKGAQWALWGGGAKPAETIKPKKARTATWRQGLVKVAAEALQDGQPADFLAIAIDQLGGQAYDGNQGKTFILYAPDYADGLPDGFAVARRCDGLWISSHMGSGLSVGNAFRSKAHALASGLDAIESAGPEKFAQALAKISTKTVNHAAALAAWRQTNGIGTEADIETRRAAMEAHYAAPAAQTQEEQTQPAAAEAQAAPEIRAYVAVAAVDLERLTNVYGYCATRRQQIEAGRAGHLAALEYIKAALQRLRAMGTGLERTEAAAALERLAEAQAAELPDTEHAQAPDVAAILAASVAIGSAQASSASAEETPNEAQAEALPELVTCDGPDTEADAAADTPTTAADAVGADHTPADSTHSDCTDPLKTSAQASDYTGARETLRADYLRAADGGNTQQAGSKTGAWSAVMFRTSDGRAGLAFKTPGHGVELIDRATGGERMRALQAMAQAAELAHQKREAAEREETAPENLDPRIMNAAQVQALSADHFERLHCALEDINDHSGALLARCLRAGVDYLADRTRQLIAAHIEAGHLTPELCNRRQAIASALRAHLDNTKAHKTPAPDFTPSHETQTEESAPEFQRTRPAHVDLRALIAQGMAPADLVGLGVHYSGDMANASGCGAIVEVQAENPRALRVVVTLEDGRHMTHLDGHSFSDHPGSRFALDFKRHGAPYLAELAAARVARTAATSSAKEVKAQQHAAELERLAAEFPHLERAGNSYSGGKMAARNIRTMLKAAFPGVKFSVTSDYSRVSTKWTDGPTDSAVHAVIGRFDIGRADYNTDYFYTEASAWSELFGGVQYLWTNREESPELIARALEAWNEKNHATATAEDWKKQAGPFSYTQKDADFYRRDFRETLNTMDATPPAKASPKSKISA